MANLNSEYKENLEKLSRFFRNIKDHGMKGMYGAVWPVIIRYVPGQHSEDSESRYVYRYPAQYFNKLAMQNQIYVFTDKKADRLSALKYLVDELMADRIDIPMYHFGLHQIYPYSSRTQEEDREAVGQKRAKFMAAQPCYDLVDNDSFFSEVWSSLIDRRFPDVGEEFVSVPTFKEIRMLFTPDQFGAYTGTHYSNADWVEPIPGRRLDVKRWIGEKDPMASQNKEEGMIEGPIILGHEGSNGLRHFVDGVPVRAGAYIEVKFGDGWIPGRYEWSFQKSSPITIHSSRDEWFSIREGHLVRIKER